MLNEQINKELYSANLYLSIASYFTEQEMTGFAHFFLIQVQEEQLHAMKQFKYIHDVGGRVKISKLEAPPHTFKNPKNAFEFTLEQERLTTKSINNLVKQAVSENDYATHTFLQWFVTEQVEEESLINTILKKLEWVGDNPSALYLLNEELAKRTLPKQTT